MVAAEVLFLGAGVGSLVMDEDLLVLGAGISFGVVSTVLVVLIVRVILIAEEAV